MSTSKNTLNFAVVGAPKCGTTSIFNSLNERNDLSFLGKDSHLLGKDLDLLLRDNNVSIESVLNNFDSSRLIGDVSVWYLFSKSAASEICKLNEEAKIIICLRNPFELIPSLHNQHVKGGDEAIADLNLALLKDFNNDSISEGVHFRTRPRYLESVDFANQIIRYQKLFNQIHFVFYEDLKADYGKVIQGIEEFLEIEPRINITRIESNTRKNISKPGLVKILKKKPAFIKSVFRTAIPSKKLRHKLMEKAMEASFSDVNNNVKKAINEENQAVIEQFIQKQLPLLKEQTGRDCSHWLNT